MKIWVWLYRYYLTYVYHWIHVCITNGTSLFICSFILYIFLFPHQATNLCCHKILLCDVNLIRITWHINPRFSVSILYLYVFLHFLNKNFYKLKFELEEHHLKAGVSQHRWPREITRQWRDWLMGPMIADLLCFMSLCEYHAWKCCLAEQTSNCHGKSSTYGWIYTR